MTCRETTQGVRPMGSATEARGYVLRLVENEVRGWGDTDNALSRLETRYAIPFWSLNNIRTGRAKTVEAGLFARIRAAYLDQCERQIALLQHQLAVEKALGDDSHEDIAAEVQGLAERIKARRAGKLTCERSEQKPPSSS